MPRYAPEPQYAHGTTPRVGILLIQLGTPDEPTPKAVRIYLREFLSDPRVVEIPKPIWALILNGIILNVRPKQSAEKYAKIWMPEGSPLKVYTERQAKLLQGRLGMTTRAPFMVRYAMRYGSPDVESVMNEMRAEGCDRILVVPMYPQYAASTTGTAMDEIGRILARTRNVPGLRFVKHFHDHPAYIRALGDSIRDYWRERGRPDKLLMSFHGLPRYTLDRGDPYHCECYKTARLLAADLELADNQWQLVFQSRFGRAEWLKPYTAATLEELGRAAMRRVDVACPGFVADCLETLEEIAMEGRDTFLEAGGKEFNAIPCLNDRTDWIAALADIVRGELAGWLPDAWNADAARAESRAAAERARALGATA
jgi:protoporphyrin/coproporphyrin ferrochelatase